MKDTKDHSTTTIKPSASKTFLLINLRVKAPNEVNTNVHVTITSDISIYVHKALSPAGLGGQAVPSAMTYLPDGLLFQTVGQPLMRRTTLTKGYHPSAQQTCQ